MINELYALSRTLKKHGIEQQAWDDNLRPLPNGNCYRIWFKDDRSVDRIELISKELATVCRKYGNNQQSFPAFNIAPLYRVTSPEDKKYISDIESGVEPCNLVRLKEICINSNWNGKLLRKIYGCLRKTIPSVPADSIVSSLMGIAAKIDATAFRDSIEKCVWGRLVNDVKVYLPILFHKGNSDKNQEDDAGSLSIMLDLASWEEYGVPIANEKTMSQINGWLQDQQDEVPTPGDSLDAFGLPYTDVSKVMPDVRITPGFEVTLRSMFREQACQYRYGKADDSSFPISPPIRKATKTSLEWIAKPANERITWQKINSDAILFVYPDTLPQIPPKFAELFGGDNIQTKQHTNQEVRFKKISENFITALNALRPHEKPKNLQVFVLHQIKPALSKRAKVVYTCNFSAEELLDSVVQWHQGCANIPPIDYLLRSPPFPLEIYKIANKVWKQNGTQADGKNPVQIMRYYQGIELLLGTLTSLHLHRIVSGMVTNYFGLVLFVGNIKHARKQTLKDSLKEEVGSFFALVGLLLYKLGFSKEEYMRETAFSIGQVLKISDEIHALYCEIKRGGDVPPQLVGNSVLLSASETPVAALALLCTRINPYISWAKQYRTKGEEKSRLAGWFLKQYELLMPTLHIGLMKQIRFTDLDKAQLFIGYLSDLPKTDNSEIKQEEGEKHGQ